ncbi:MAG: PDZ domain-containing protein [Acidobacteria bacterium]|nr:PDZ domain-containing protein [Acidobacteriota bacterium]
MPAGRSLPWSRETRLLLLTIAVSVTVLLVLARFRFPDEAPAAPAQPLERLAARATFDELAGIVERLDRTVAPSLVVLRRGAPESLAPRALRSLLDGPASTGDAVSYVPALRVRPTAVLTLLGPGQTVQGVVGDESAVPILLARDPIRRLALVRVPAPAPDVAWQWRAMNPISVPRYVVSVEASRGGSTLRPVFFGRADRFTEPRWRVPLLVLGHTTIAAEGSFVFSLEGELVGLAVAEAGVMAVVPADALQAAADRLFEEGSPHITDFGVVLRPLSPGEGKTFGSSSGLVIASVAKGALGEGHLRAGDLLLAVDGNPAVNPESVLLRLATVAPGATVRLALRRGAAMLTVPITVPARGASGQVS